MQGLHCPVCTALRFSKCKGFPRSRDRGKRRNHVLSGFALHRGKPKQAIYRVMGLSTGCPCRSKLTGHPRETYSNEQEDSSWSTVSFVSRVQDQIIDVPPSIFLHAEVQFLKILTFRSLWHGKAPSRTGGGEWTVPRHRSISSCHDLHDELIQEGQGNVGAARDGIQDANFPSFLTETSFSITVLILLHPLRNFTSS